MHPPLSTKKNTLRSRFLYGLFIPVILFLCSTLVRIQRAEAGVKNTELEILHHHDDGATYSALNLSAPTIPAFSLTAILPIRQSSFSGLEEALKSLLGPSQLREIILLCPRADTLRARSVIRSIVSSYPDCPDIRLQTLATYTVAHASTIQAASRVSGWVLILDHDALVRQNNHSRETLLRPPALSFPYGPRGVCYSSFDNLEPCIRRSVGFPQEAHHLLPPFVMPAVLADPHVSLSPTVDAWRTLGENVASSRTDGLGGIVFGTGVHTEPQVMKLQQALHDLSGGTSGLLHDNGSTRKVYFGNMTLPTRYSDLGTFVVVLQTFEDFRKLSPLLCMLQNLGQHIIETWIYDGTESNMKDGQFRASKSCALSYSPLSPPPTRKSQAQQFLAWIDSHISRADVILSVREDNRLTAFLSNPTPRLREGSVSVRLSRCDLPHTEWMGSLSLVEWKNWNQPNIDISIITNNRPHSLKRLLNSLSNAHFYGDTVDLRMNLERSADEETLKIVEELSWPHGPIFIHHRIVQGGLMTAVVESWYPRSNDRYGLLLEDDIELSPLFYAWAKMSLLRYRHGDTSNTSPLMFGISLYQQKNVELPPEGRRLFNARTLFSINNHPNPTTPYLSSIPCSWGAIYFPEHWREFHTYLSLRLSESILPLSYPIVTNVRSNKWTKSWKKYFIELVHLRGYVMLYPNYPDFVSLSTNHLEVGSHVKVRTQEKQKQFIVPLMESTNCSTIGLLDLPGRALPSWDTLPVLNLTGDLATLESLAEVGWMRRKELTGCTSNLTFFDARQLLCLPPNK